MGKRIVARGRIHPPMGDYRLKELEWLDNEQVWFDLEPLPRLTPKEEWDYLDGEILE